MRRGRIPAVLFFTAAISIAGLAQAANKPCTGSKGGISHCAGDKFVCNDGSISGSKKVCSMPGNSAATVTAAPKAKSATSCDCRRGSYCSGPRGGTYCYSDRGKKSYVRR